MKDYLLTLSKRGRAKFISHLDLYRTLERALRRSLLPISFTQGFNPHPDISFLTALELGATSDCEKAIITLREPLPPFQIKERLNRFLPQGIKIEDVSQLGNKKIIADSTLFRLTVSFSEELDKEKIEEAIEKLKSLPSFTTQREKKGKIKEINLKNFLGDLSLRAFAPGYADLEALVAITPSGSIKPREIIYALQTFLPSLRLLQVHREKLFIKEKEK